VSDPKKAKQKADAFRAQGLCGCGREPIKGKKTCQRCRDLGKKVQEKYKKYALEHGVSLAEAQIACRTRRWKKNEIPASWLAL
jgi:hypothetical protein